MNPLPVSSCGIYQCRYAASIYYLINCFINICPYLSRCETLLMLQYIIFHKTRQEWGSEQYTILTNWWFQHKNKLFKNTLSRYLKNNLKGLFSKMTSYEEESKKQENCFIRIQNYITVEPILLSIGIPLFLQSIGMQNLVLEKVNVDLCKVEDIF